MRSRNHYMPRIDSTLKLKDGRTLGYATVGDPDGREVLYFHGGMSSRLDVEFADKQLFDLNVKVIAPDRPGIGLSDRQIGRTLSDWAADTRELLLALNLKNLPVLGWSLGAPYALACAALVGDKLARVGTIGGIGPMDYQGAIESLGLLEDRILLSWPEPLLHVLCPVGIMFKYWPPKKMKRELLRAVKAGPDYEICEALSLEDATAFAYEALRQGFEGTLDDYLALRKPWGFKVEEINREVFLWQGTDDNLCPRIAGEKLASRLPHGKLIMVENSGHFLLHKHLPNVLSVLLDDENNN
jgi:pimeloyl-ACP methyl ester carboxylesterase